MKSEVCGPPTSIATGDGIASLVAAREKYIYLSALREMI